MENLNVDITLVDRKVQFSALSASNPERPIIFDYSQPVGEGQGFAGLEVLLMSFAGCVSTAIVFLLKKSGKHVSSYRAHAVGIRRESPLSLKKINFEVIMESEDAAAEDIESAVSRAADLSPVWLAIKNNVEVDIEYKLSK
jgi:uncharacterized OsmC-like protein